MFQLDTIQHLKNHRSIRSFTDQKISTDLLHTLMDAGKSAPSSSFIQCTSVIRITDRSIREALTEMCSQQAHIRSCAEFLVFCIDFNRHQQIVPEAKLGFIEQLLTGAVDVSLFAQNLSVAAESVGLGTVYIGAVRNKPMEISALLNLPDHVFPLFGLCLGYPADTPEIKPRLPHSILLHENTYQKISTPALTQDLHTYDQTLKQYFESRTDNPKVSTWSESIAHKLLKEARPFLWECLKAKGFAEK
jgi:nitroreductase